MSIGKHEEARGGPVQAEGATLEQNVFSNIGLSIDREHKNSRLKLKFQKSVFMNRPTVQPVPPPVSLILNS